VSIQVAPGGLKSVDAAALEKIAAEFRGR